MVQFYRKTHEYSEPPATALLAFFLRYPNPFARHVLSVDVLSRTINPITGQIHTTRLIVKRGILPKWASSWIPGTSNGGKGLDAWVLEESIVDPPGWNPAGGEYGMAPRLKVEQGNMNHRKFMHVIEGGELGAGSSGGTRHITRAEVRSDLGGAWSSMIRSRIENYGVGKFEVNTETARKGMSLILSLLRNRQPLPDTAEFYPPPPPNFGEAWPAPTPPPKRESSPASFFLSPSSLASLRERWRERPDENKENG